MAPLESFLSDRAIRGWWLTPGLHPAPTHRSSTHFRLPRVLGGGPTVARETYGQSIRWRSWTARGQGNVDDDYFPLTSVTLLDGVRAGATCEYKFKSCYDSALGPREAQTRNLPATTQRPTTVLRALVLRSCN